MQGLHLIADIYDIGSGQSLLTDREQLERLCTEAAVAAGLTVLRATFYTFDAPPASDDSEPMESGGVTGMVLLAESHAAIHTWPELNAATLDVYVCNHQKDNSSKAQTLFDAIMHALSPGRVRVERVIRGDLDYPETSPGPLELEWLSGDMAYGLRTQRCLLSERSAYQNVQIFDTAQFGRMMKIDDHFMTSEGDEFFYHEAMIHPAALSHPAPKRALVIGGGDGGSSEELLKHPTIEQIVLVELDAVVLDAARQYLQKVHRGSLDDARVQVHVEDGMQYLASCNQTFDLIVFDLTDPDTPAHSLYSPSSFALVRDRLDEGGALMIHIGSPTFNPSRVRSLLSDLRTVFDKVRLLGTYVPLYGCYWCMAVCSSTLDPLSVDEATIASRMRERGLRDLSLYTPRMHIGLFALPAFVEALLPEQ